MYLLSHLIHTSAPFFNNTNTHTYCNNLQQLSSARLDDSGATVSEGCANLAGKVRENIALRRGWLVAGGPNSKFNLLLLMTEQLGRSL